MTATAKPGNSIALQTTGPAVWAAAVVTAASGVGELTLVDAMLLLAVLVIVPAGVLLLPATGNRPTVATVAAGLTVAPALLLDRGLLAGALVLPWAALTGIHALIAARAWWKDGHRWRDSVWPAAAGYLAVGAAWLLADRLDLDPGGFAAPLVQLTAIHFHYAGFASVVLVASAWRRLPASRTAAAAATATVIAPPLVAVGFTHVGALQLAGAALLTAGLWLYAWVTVRQVVPTTTSVPALLLAVSSVSVLVPMALAVQWAAGSSLGTPALSIPDMVRAHGVVNAVGFALLGVIGWRLADKEAAVSGPSGGRGGPRA